MPLDVIMPALGMAQETGVIVAWHKKPGDPVAEGDVLFEVETDKATMEVEAQGSGFLGGVTAKEGDEVAVGKTIARISDSTDDASSEPETEAGAPAPDSGGTEALPDGKPVIMPTLGMAQDSGLLVAWLVEPGGKVGADDPLFEVETDKSTMEVPAGVDGYLAARLAEAGEDVPTGQTIAIISAEPPENPVTRSAASGAPAPAPKAEAPSREPAAAPAPRATPAPVKADASSTDRILASPKARRLALEQGLDLARLAAAGHPQPFHVKDLEALKALPAETPAEAQAGGPAARHLTAEVPGEAFAEFCDWAAAQAGLGDPSVLLAGLAGGCLDRDTVLVAHEAPGRRRLFTVPRGAALGAVSEAEEGTPDLILRDLRLTRLTALTLGAEEAPTLTLTRNGAGVTITLECAAGQLSAPAAVSLLSDVAGRLEQPLRALL
ncbi:biotin/lipoyl-containing protein [Ovoidimarina sediminis]|uniref:biotin/lipoyl-containing protein n=1 Tax=Ovoidimarina sediminis TaxID=3079856 RepID=UPI002905FEE7|nr:biotin/lipoyl-containing protein [Rhodophyticola sp. MJ-SS7]MDU8944144.1 biotin/lipoyl-containing protein [Rhodophyticola sp. MJ-SS7]